MSKLAEVVSHLTVDELYERYRRSESVFERTQWQILWWRARGLGTGEVTKLTGYQPDWIRRIVRRYNAEGPDGVVDRRLQNGAEPMLNEALQEELLSLLQGPAPDGGLWNSVKVGRWMSEKLGRPVGKQRGWDYLRRLGLSPQRPRPRHVDANSDDQEAFKKNSARSWRPSALAIPTPPSSFGAKTKRDSV
jgi:transposase